MRYNSSFVGGKENQNEDVEVNFKFKCEVTHLILFNVGNFRPVPNKVGQAVGPYNCSPENLILEFLR
jgi:hypothetical protein